jgi:hypothetical protein
MKSWLFSNTGGAVYGALSVIECVRIIRYVKANQIDERDGDESVNLQLVDEGDGVGPRRLLAMTMLVMNLCNAANNGQGRNISSLKSFALFGTESFDRQMEMEYVRAKAGWKCFGSTRELRTAPGMPKKGIVFEVIEEIGPKKLMLIYTEHPRFFQASIR